MPFVVSAPYLVPAQEIPDDPNPLPQMIGRRKTNLQSEGAVTVTGKVVLENFDPSQPRPIVYVYAYSSGRPVEKALVRDSGNYTINGVPKDYASVVVEVDGVEVARQQLMAGNVNIIYQDFYITLPQFMKAKNSPSAISAKTFYKRTDQNQKLFEKAIAALKEKKNDEALASLQQILKSDPKDFVVWYQTANLYFLSGKYAAAEDGYIRSVEIKPDFFPGIFGLGTLYLDTKNYENAIVVLSNAVALDKESADAQQFLGEAYLRAKKGSKAIPFFNNALKLAPIEKAEIHLRLAALYDAAGMKDRASLEYKKFLEKVPNHPDKEKLTDYIKLNPPK
jgi:tetratricopeptide (TPR) repeat protein